MQYANGFTKEYASNYYYHTGGHQEIFGIPERIFQRNFKFFEKTDIKFYYPIFVVAQSFNLTKPLELPPKIVKKIKQKKCKILLINAFEGWAYDYSHDVYIYILQKKYKLEFDDFVIVSANMAKHPLVNTLYLNVWETTYSYIMEDTLQKLDFKNKILSSTTCDNRFICLNRRPRSHRIAVLTLLHDYRDTGILTMGTGDANIPQFSYDSQLTEFMHLYKSLSDEYNELDIRKDLPYVYDMDTSIECPAEDQDIDKFINSYLHIVTETLVSNDPNQIFFSEKTFKPIVFMRPFVLINRAGALKQLHEMGFKTFSDVIDESYDDIVDNEQRVIAAINAAIDFFIKPKDELNTILINMLDRLEHNHLTLQKRKNKMLKSISKKLNNYLG